MLFYIYIKGILAQIFNGYSPENEKTFKEHMLFYLSVDAVGGENMAQLYFNDFPEIGNVRSDQIRNQKTKTKTKTKTKQNLHCRSLSFFLTQVY